MSRGLGDQTNWGAACLVDFARHLGNCWKQWRQRGVKVEEWRFSVALLWKSGASA